MAMSGAKENSGRFQDEWCRRRLGERERGAVWDKVGIREMILKIRVEDLFGVLSLDCLSLGFF
jgi:hypothetical protein